MNFGGCRKLWCHFCVLKKKMTREKWCNLMRTSRGDKKNSFSSKFSKIRGGGFRTIRGFKYFRRLIKALTMNECEE